MTAASPSLGRGDADVTAADRRFSDRLIDLAPLAAAAAAAVLALTSTGSMVVAAVLLGVAVGDRRTFAAALLTVAAVAVRFSTTSFDDLAGIQSVLGDAVAVGPVTAAASAWFAAGALLLSAGSRWPGAAGRTLDAATTAVAAGCFAAAVAFGQGPGGALGVRLLASVVATLLAAGMVVLDQRWGIRWAAGRRWLAVASGLLALVLAAWP